jgi:hypothetical protein
MQIIYSILKKIKGSEKRNLFMQYFLVFNRKKYLKKYREKKAVIVIVNLIQIFKIVYFFFFLALIFY